MTHLETQPPQAEILTGMIRESSRQSDSNVRALEASESYWNESPGSATTKLENFTKYVSRESLTKFLCRNEAFLKQLEVHGSIVEFGVARGASLLTWAHLSAIHEPTNYMRRIVGFDTFRGFPSLHGKDTAGTSEHLHTGGFEVEAGMAQDIEQAVEILDMTRYLGHIPKVSLVEGDVLETLPSFLEKSPHMVVSLLHLDIDLYEPTKLALELLVPRMPRGAVILFDELDMPEFPGETQAVLESVGLSNLRLKRFPYATCMSYAMLE